MPIEGFDYKAFAVDLSKQAMEILNQQGGNAAPDSLTDADKKTIVETVRKFCFMCGEALSNDPQLKFTAEQASLVTQFIGEWTFHKSIDLINGKIPQQNRDAVLQVIAANILYCIISDFFSKHYDFCSFCFERYHITILFFPAY